MLGHFHFRSLLFWAFVHIVSNAPLIVILNDAKELIRVLLEGLTLLSKDVSDKDTLYDLLLVLSRILTDENAYLRNRCLVATSELPHTRIYPTRIQVLQAMAKTLDDPKRAVHVEAVRCWQAWASIASRSRHF